MRQIEVPEDLALWESENFLTARHVVTIDNTSPGSLCVVNVHCRKRKLTHQPKKYLLALNAQKQNIPVLNTQLSGCQLKDITMRTQSACLQNNREPKSQTQNRGK